MDRHDRSLLVALQRDSSISIAALAEQNGLSTSACHRRVRALESDGYITGYVARIDPHKIGLRVHVFVEITLSSQSRDAMERFEAAVQSYDDILDCHLMSGEADYLLSIAAADLDHFDRIHRNCLSRLPGVTSMRSSFSIRIVKRRKGYLVEG